MKTNLFLILLLFTISINPAFSQSYEKPYVESVGDRICFITKVELAKQYTIISFEHLNNNGWIRVDPAMVIRTPDNKKYSLVKVEGIAVAPDKYEFREDEERHSFKVYFKPLPKDTKVFDIIEAEPGSRYDFNFYGVDLTKKRESDKQKSHFVEDEIIADSPAGQSPFPGFSGGFENMFKDVYRSAIDAYFNYLKQPEKLKELARLNKQFYDALISEGFTKEQAMQILSSTPMLPNIGGK